MKGHVGSIYAVIEAGIDLIVSGGLISNLNTSGSNYTHPNQLLSELQVMIESSGYGL